MASALSVATRGRRKNTSRRGSPAKRKANTTALARAESNVKRLQNRLKNANLNARRGGEAAVNVLETQLALFGTGYLTGRMGADKLKVFNMDGRLLAGIGLGGWGLWDAAMGGGAMASHALALGNGVFGGLVYEWGQEAGVKSKSPAGFGGQGQFGREVYVTPGIGARAGLRRG